MESFTGEELLYLSIIGAMIGFLIVIFGLVAVDIAKFIINKKRFNKKADSILRRWKKDV